MMGVGTTMARTFLFVALFCCLVSAGKVKKDGDSLRFLVMGDWGGLPDFPFRTPIEKAVGKQMGRIAFKLGLQFTLALGDNFYFDGVKDVDDPRFQETFNGVFTEPSLQSAWYFLAGNHDWNGNVSAQVEYSKRMKRWNFPSLYYLIKLKIPNTELTMDILMIDTIILCGNSDADTLHKQPVLMWSEAADEQWNWIEDNLRNSKAHYLVVAGHYPVLSIAEHGPTHCLVDRLMPMLYKYHVTAYFCGHEHNLQHLEYAMPPYNHTVEYFVSGAANFIDPLILHRNSVPSGSSKFHWANILSLGGFSYVEATKTQMNFTFMEASGKILYQKTMLPRKV